MLNALFSTIKKVKKPIHPARYRFRHSPWHSSSAGTLVGEFACVSPRIGNRVKSCHFVVQNAAALCHSARSLRN